MTHPRPPKITVPMRAKSRMKRRGDSIPIAWCTVLANSIIHALMLPPRLCRMEGSGLADERRCLRLGARTGPRATPAKADSSGLKPPRNDKREAVWHSSAPLRVGSEVVPFPKRTSGDARAYIDDRTRAGTLAPTSTTAHERDARAYIDNSTRAGTLAPTSTTVRGRGRPRHTRRGQEEA